VLIPVINFLTTNIYSNVTHDTYKGALDGDILMFREQFFCQHKHQLKFKKGWSAEVSGFYRSKGIESR